MRILSIIGTRPEALKMAPILQRLKSISNIESIVCISGQHRELLQGTLALFDIEADIDLALLKRNQAPDKLLARLLTKLGPLLQQVNPDWILAVGDTTSVLGASLASAHHQVSFGHIEAGLRTATKTDPFPEEFNRRVTSVLADLHFAPTAQARSNLLQENIPASSIIVTGNPIIDTLKCFSNRPDPTNLNPLWRQLQLDPHTEGKAPHLLLVTFHRRENIGRPIKEICAALRDLALINKGALKVLCIIHPNPAVHAPARRDLTNAPNIVLSHPLDYPSMIAVLKRSHLILTDSGGLQEEAPWLKVPTLILRNSTERPEGLKAGVTRLIGTTRSRIVTEVQNIIKNPDLYRKMSKGFRGYGDGRAAEHIVNALQNHNNLNQNK